MSFHIAQKAFGMYEQQPVTAYTIINPSGMELTILDYGGTITRLLTPDRDKKMGDVVLGFDSLSGYLQTTNPYFGALIGRYGNRIGKGKFQLDGKSYQLAVNDHGNTLHGGLKGLDKVRWNAKPLPGDSSLQLNYTSPDGDEGFPGTLQVQVTYTLRSDNTLVIAYEATTDKPTPVNLTNHAYYNLSAGRDATILGQEVMIHAAKYTAVDSELIPTGALPEVKGTPMDFTRAKPIGRDIEQVKGGYDHNWVLDKQGTELGLAATAYDPGSGRRMEVWTTQPGLQFYTGNFLDSTLHGKYGKVYPKHGAFCMETQHFPDGPNHPDFPNTILKPGETYRSTTEYRFSVQ